MASVFLNVTYFGEDGDPVGCASQMYLPDYLDRRDIRAKAFWFLQRGEGHPETKHVLLNSQGQQRLVTIVEPLRLHKYTELKEKDHGLEERVLEYVTREGIGYGPRNQ